MVTTRIIFVAMIGGDLPSTSRRQRHPPEPRYDRCPQGLQSALMGHCALFETSLLSSLRVWGVSGIVDQQEGDAVLIHLPTNSLIMKPRHGSGPASAVIAAKRARDFLQNVEWLPMSAEHILSSSSKGVVE